MYANILVRKVGPAQGPVEGGEAGGINASRDGHFQSKACSLCWLNQGCVHTIKSRAQSSRYSKLGTTPLGLAPSKWVKKPVA